MIFESQRLIHAPPERVWQLLTDAGFLVKAQLGILSLEGEIKPGKRLKLRSQADPRRVFSLRVSVFSPPHHMVWRGGMPFGLFTGERSFRLTPCAKGCEFHLQERFTGPLSPLICKTIPDLQPSFETFCTKIKEHAEQENTS